MAFAPLLVFLIGIAGIYALFTWRARRVERTSKSASKWTSTKNLNRTVVGIVLVALVSLAVVSATSHDLSFNVIILDAPFLIFTGATLVWVYTMRRSRDS